MSINKLNDGELKAIVSAFRKEPFLKRLTKSDGGGLWIFFNPNGKFEWWYRYKIGGKENSMPLGSYPEVGLSEARDLHRVAKLVWKSGKDPAQVRRDERAINTSALESRFEAVALKWFDKWKIGKTDKTTKEKLLGLERDLFPILGRTPVNEIETSDIIRAHRKIESRGTHSVNQKVWSTGSEVFEYAVASGLCKRNPYAGTRFQAAFKVNQTIHYPTINKDKVPELLRAIDSFTGYEWTKLALKLSTYLFVRKMELLQATWDEIDLEAGRWVIPASRIKTRSYDLIVDLPIQALEIMERLKELSGKSDYLFPARNGKGHMDKTTPLKALHSMGYKGEMSIHGFRAMAATQLKALNYAESFIERQLSHIEGSKTKHAYYRDQHLEDLPQRKAMLQDWANYLDAIKQGAEVIPLHAKVS